jgi:hypothetical protein
MAVLIFFRRALIFLVVFLWTPFVYKPIDGVYVPIAPLPSIARSTLEARARTKPSNNATLLESFTAAVMMPGVLVRTDLRKLADFNGDTPDWEGLVTNASQKIISLHHEALGLAANRTNWWSHVEERPRFMLVTSSYFCAAGAFLTIVCRRYVALIALCILLTGLANFLLYTVAWDECHPTPQALVALALCLIEARAAYHAGRRNAAAKAREVARDNGAGTSAPAKKFANPGAKPKKTKKTD